MGKTIGEIDLGLNINQGLFSKQINGLTKSAQAPITNAFKPIGTMIAGALAIGSITKFTKECLDLGSDLTEVQNVVDTTFKTLSSSVNEFAPNAMTSFGLSETVAKQYMGTLGAMSKSMGFSEQASYDMASAVTGLAGDVASFYNLSTDEAFDKLKSIWTGETETLKSIGVLLTQANLDQYALNNGFGKTTASMTEQEKVMLRYQYTMSALSDASGDFAKTSGSWANQTRILTLQFDSLKATLGQGFINLFTPIIQMINNLLSKLQLLAQQFKAFTEMVAGNRGGTESAVANIATDAASAATELGGVETAAKKAAKATGLLALDELNILNTSSDTTGTGTTTSATDINAINTATETTNGLIGDVNSSIEELTQSIEPFTSSLKRLWDEGLSKLGAFSITGLKDLYNEFLAPLGEWAFGTEDKGFTRLVDIINDDLCNIDWDGINKNLKDFWTAIEPYAENFGEGLIDFFEKAGDFSVDVINDLFGTDGVIVGLTDWLNDNDPENARTWGEALGALFTGIIVFRAVSPAIKGLQAAQSVLSLLGKTKAATGLTEAFSSLGDLKGILTTDLATVFGAGTAAEIGLTIGTGIIGGIATAIAGFEFGKWLGEQLFPDDTEWYENFKWFGEEGFFDTIFGTDLETHFDAIKEMSGDFGGLIGILDDVKEKVSGTGLEFEDLFFGVDDLVEKAKPLIEDWFQENVAPWLTKEKWEELGNNAKDALSGKWKEFKEWWDESALVKWWNESIAPWFTKEKWTEMLQSIPGVFKESFKGAVNKAIESLNSAIGGVELLVNQAFEGLKGLADLANKVPGVNIQLGNEDISLPRIPMLAQGGYVGPNQPQLAMIGDNRRYGEIVSPEDKLQEMASKAVATALKASGGMSDKYAEKIIALLNIIIELLSEGMVMEVDGERFAKLIKKLNQEYFMATGKYLLEV